MIATGDGPSIAAVAARRVDGPCSRSVRVRSSPAWSPTARRGAISYRPPSSHSLTSTGPSGNVLVPVRNHIRSRTWRRAPGGERSRRRGHDGSAAWLDVPDDASTDTAPTLTGTSGAVGRVSVAERLGRPVTPAHRSRPATSSTPSWRRRCSSGPPRCTSASRRRSPPRAGAAARRRVGARGQARSRWTCDS